jgi:DNA polymerase (family X)
MKNSDVAGIFYKIADLLEIKGIAWKPEAYKRAARSIESLFIPVDDIYKKKGLKGLDDIPSVGKGLAKKIEEFLLTGKIKEFELIKKGLPSGLDVLLNVKGIGPKKAFELYKKLGIKNIDNLLDSAKKGKIQRLSGFGVKSEQDILRAVDLNEKNKRIPLKKILPVAEKVKNALSCLSFVKNVEIAGSIRRKKDSIKDIDVVVLSDFPEKVIDFFVKMNDVKLVLGKGKKKCSLVLKNGIGVDVRIFDKDSFGAGLLYFTGSKDYNIRLRNLAIKKGFKLNEYGLFKGKKRIAGFSEKDIYEKLGLKFIEPDKRID